MVECLAQLHTDWFLLSTVKPVKICHWLVKLEVGLVAREVLEGCQCSSFFSNKLQMFLTTSMNILHDKIEVQVLSIIRLFLVK